jgi:hypothetical protein
MDRLLSFLHWVLIGFRKRVLKKENPRAFTNRILRKYLRYFSGDIINVSGWQDADKQGGYYRDYYDSRRRYVISNIDGECGMPSYVPDGVESMYVNLDYPLSPQLRLRFDVVFSHTVLEHVFNVRQALQNLADLSRDVVVTVVPFSQQVHHTTSFSDYIRLTPFFLKKFFEERGFSVLLCAVNDQPFTPIYILFIVTRYPEKYKHLFSNAPLQYDVQIYPSRGGRYGSKGLTKVGE